MIFTAAPCYGGAVVTTEYIYPGSRGTCFHPFRVLRKVVILIEYIRGVHGYADRWPADRRDSELYA